MLFYCLLNVIRAVLFPAFVLGFRWNVGSLPRGGDSTGYCVWFFLVVFFLRKRCPKNPPDKSGRYGRRQHTPGKSQPPPPKKKHWPSLALEESGRIRLNIRRTPLPSLWLPRRNKDKLINSRVGCDCCQSRAGAEERGEGRWRGGGFGALMPALCVF